MLQIQIDGQNLTVPDGSTIMDATDKAGIYVPHFCYHRKLSVAANCRMCLVQVEKAAKPLPACATPVTDGMVVQTRSDVAVKAQKGVMEFLLINHPLDCPICDQGGECQLQDLAVGYGDSNSRYQEVKRVVPNKDLGPLISTDMTRCIHCTRCVRFGQEIAGVMELGMVGRGEHAEIMPFVEGAVNSELSGNVIDLCPVGALTSKPYRYTARPWELSRRKSISPHDGLGANLIIQVRQNRVMRVLPADNEAVNECWLADRDRFSYEGLNSEERLTRPMLRHGDDWVEVEWQQALEFVATRLMEIRKAHGADQVAALASPHATLEELYLLQKLTRAFGSPHVDHRLRQSDFSADAALQGAPWLGQPVAELSEADGVLVIGSNLRKEQPLIAHRLRQAVKRGGKLSVLNPVDDDLLTRIAHKLIVAPADMVRALAQLVAAAGEGKTLSAGLGEKLAGVEASDRARGVAQTLASGQRRAILLGAIAQHHPQFATLYALASELARLTGATLGFLAPAANSVGAVLAGAVPNAGLNGQPVAKRGLNARELVEQPRRAYLLWGIEPELDAHDPQRAEAALRAAEFVVAFTSYHTKAADYAHLLLPVSPFTETSGSFVNTEGRLQHFNAAVKPLGDSRPGWKVLRVLANLLDLPGFDHDASEAVRNEWQAAAGTLRLDNALDNALGAVELQGLDGRPADGKLQRIGEVPIYQLDPVVRRAPSLQATKDAAPPVVSVSAALMRRLALSEGALVRVTQGGGHAVLPVVRDDRLPDACVRVAAGHPLTAGLGAMFGELGLEPA